MSILAMAALVVYIGLAAILLLNVRTFPRLTRYAQQSRQNDWPAVSILVPARNEAAGIGMTVSGLLGQKYSGWFEVIVLDDGSEDETAHMALQAAGGDARFRLVCGRSLPPGWAGKSWACHQLADQARGDIFVFTDADVTWSPGALSTLMACMRSQSADLFSVWPTQITKSWGERLVVPMMMFAVLCYLPEVCVRFVPLAAFASANGQCLVFRKEAYRRIGGHAAVRGSVLEDVHLARAGKRARMKLAMALGDGLISTRMYRSWKETRQGFAKNILAGHGNAPFFLLLSGMFHWALMLLPFLWLCAGWALPDRHGWPQIPAAMVGAAWSLRALSAAVSKERVQDAFFLPVTTILFTIIAAESLWWHFRWGGPTWKGRRIAARGRS